MNISAIKFSHFVLILLALNMLSGCNGNSRLSGKVTFSDGEPVKQGMVIFTTDTFQARGEIQKDGSYTVSSRGKNDGIPQGNYRVSLTGVVKIDTQNGRNPMPFPVTICDEKYLKPETSGLTCTIPAAGNRFDIVLDPHPKNYP